MEIVRELKPGENYSYYDDNGILRCDSNTFNKKITVDSNDFEYSINDEPGIIFYYKGRELSKCWRKHGYQHRLTGPSYISYEFGFNQYWIKGKKLRKDEFEIERNRLELLNEIE